MKRPYQAVLAVILCVGLLFSLSACGQATDTPVLMPQAVRQDGTRDLMTEAIGLSGYAESKLQDLTAYGYGDGKFPEYLAMHADPLTAASYPLKLQAEARKVDANGTALPAFSRFVLEKTGFLVKKFVEHTPSEDLTVAWNELFEAAGKTPTAPPTGIVSAAKAPIARWLSTAAKAYTIVAKQTKTVTAAEFSALASFAYTNCAGGEEQARPVELMRACADKIDLNEMLKAGQLLTEATVRLTAELKGIDKLTENNRQLAVKTPLGMLMLGTSEDDLYRVADALLLIDPAGDDTYQGRVATSRSLAQPLSVAIDLQGDDKYQSEGYPSQGCGILGVGLLFDLGGDDTYSSSKMAQGCAMLGTGLLFDGEGNDRYTCLTTGQAAGFFGLAMLLDARGNDVYDGYAFVQSSAGHRCVSYLVDREGDDSYQVVKAPPEEYGNLDYGKVAPGRAGNFSQGCGWGQRVVQSEENGAAGGIAGMIDLGGNDRYSGSVWIQGTGYWSGVGFLYNEGGDDIYDSFHYAQAAVAHYGVGTFVDIGGNDRHEHGQASGVGFVWDRGLSTFINDGGNDTYTCPGAFGGAANSAYDEKGLEQQDMTYAFFVDTEGDDGYIGTALNRFGHGRGGYFLDADGKDVYMSTFTNGFVDTSAMRQGGVFIDATRSDKEIPYVAFWEKAKETYGFLPIE